MYKNYEDKLNTILSNAKSEKVEKVELSLVDDADKKANEVKKVTADFIKEINTFEKAKDNLKSSIKGRTQQSIDLLNAIKDIDKAAKDLGIKIPTVKYEKVLDEYYKIVDRVDSLLK